ncbi:peptidoglycan-binding protein [Streptomyces albipurpureus]|uniref:Peptidoglycan-binding protein n=1 Tax=Streptomyces albipurpureus TaxID=2897419 RepID=A0ABT0UKT5_9ACTN|nr:peptidoglycan-binding protein [Streptomyces sp. CWNU-1]MCM2388981.1 peptidoglycan-binding protein [Streptomyces sp. CWNU-1]
MRFVTRAQWGAQPARESQKPLPSPRGVKVHYLGAFYRGREHHECAGHMRHVQSDHLNNKEEDYFDIAYNLGVCQHGYVFEGRGAGNQSAANGGTQLNRDHVAVLTFLGNTGITQPTQSQITGIQDAIAYLRRNGAGNEIRGHRDGFATLCPGNTMYALVQNGTLDPGTLYDGGTHTVAVNETLGEISLKYNVPRSYIIAVNRLQSPYNLIVGQQLTVPARGVPLGQDVPGGGDNGGEEPPPAGYVAFPGTEWFKALPYSPIVTALGRRLVAEGCGTYTTGPGPQWTDTDRASYTKWQQKLGYTGTAADGWPGKTTWNQLKVPDEGITPVPVDYEPFPGAEWFQTNPNSPIIIEMGKRLVAEGCGTYTTGPGPQWTEADRLSYQNWQQKLGYTGTAADGWPGATTWYELRVPRVTPVEYEPYPGPEWFQTNPSSPIITAMGRRLVAEGCGVYTGGPGPQWTEADRLSYQKWQQKLGYTGTAADGWPGKTTWDQLKVPRQTPVQLEPFPSAAWFQTNPSSPIITAMGKRLVAEGCGDYEHSPGPQWTEADRLSYQNWQQKLGYTGTAADGWPGKTTWDQLKVPRS